MLNPIDKLPQNSFVCLQVAIIKSSITKVRGQRIADSLSLNSALNLIHYSWSSYQTSPAANWVRVRVSTGVSSTTATGTGHFWDVFCLKSRRKPPNTAVRTLKPIHVGSGRHPLASTWRWNQNAQWACRVRSSRELVVAVNRPRPHTFYFNYWEIITRITTWVQRASSDRSSIKDITWECIPRAKCNIS